MYRFNLKNTNYIKGVAILLLLFHHLFSGTVPGAIENLNISGTPWYCYFARYAKTCVAIFTIMSGYGLYASTSTDYSVKKFYLKRYSKFYLNYWVIFIIFVPLKILVTPELLANGALMFHSVLSDALGFTYFFNGRISNINPTWWYISSILFLYFLFPFFRLLLDRFNTWFLLLSLYSLISVVIPTQLFTQLHLFETVYWLIFPFILGMYCAKNDIFSKIMNYGSKYSSVFFKWIVFFILFAIFLYLREFSGIMTDLLFDGMGGGVLIFILNESSKLNGKFTNLINLLGKHSMNIFLFHTFIFADLLPKVIYSTKSICLDYIIMILFCLAISMAIEMFKRLIGIPILYGRLKLFIDGKELNK